MKEYTEFTKKGKIGVKDSSGKIILEPIYDGIWLNWVGLGFIAVSLNDKLGLFDLQGKLILEPIYNVIWGNGHFIFVRLNHKYGLFDKKGNQLLPVKYERWVGLVYLYKKRLKIKEDLLK